MFRLCLLLVLFGMIYCMDAVEIDNLLEAEGRDQEEKKDLHKLEELLIKKELKELYDVLKLKTRGSGSSSEEDTENAPITAELQAANVWGDVAIPEKERVIQIIQQWESLIPVHDPDVIVNKYSKDVIYIYSKDGEEHEALTRDESKELYRTWFNEGVDRLVVNYDTVKGGALGPDHLWLINDVTLFDKDKQNIGALTNTVILKRIPANESNTGKSGYQVMVVSETKG